MDVQLPNDFVQTSGYTVSVFGHGLNCVIKEIAGVEMVSEEVSGKKK